MLSSDQLTSYTIPSSFKTLPLQRSLFIIALRHTRPSVDNSNSVFSCFDIDPRFVFMRHCAWFSNVYAQTKLLLLLLFYLNDAKKHLYKLSIL